VACTHKALALHVMTNLPVGSAYAEQISTAGLARWLVPHGDVSEHMQLTPAGHVVMSIVANDEDDQRWFGHADSEGGRSAFDPMPPGAQFVPVADPGNMQAVASYCAFARVQYNMQLVAMETGPWLHEQHVRPAFLRAAVVVGLDVEMKESDCNDSKSGTDSSPVMKGDDDVDGGTDTEDAQEVAEVLGQVGGKRAYHPPRTRNNKKSKRQ
jgi:hypothetical protein